jgi:hypothetical protein
MYCFWEGKDNFIKTIVEPVVRQEQPMKEVAYWWRDVVVMVMMVVVGYMIMSDVAGVVGFPNIRSATLEWLEERGLSGTDLVKLLGELGK